MKILYKDVNINYSYFDNKSKIDLVYLHGWGQNIEMMMPIAKPFMKQQLWLGKQRTLDYL